MAGSLPPPGRPARTRRAGLLRGVRWGRLLGLGLLALPVVEVWLAMVVADTIGWPWTLALLAGLSVLGFLVLRHEGRRAWTAFAEAARAGREPSELAADGALVVVAGSLLLVPGFLTAALGMLLLVPRLRRAVRRTVVRRVGERVVLVRPAGPGPAAPGPVIPAEVVDPD